MLKIWLCRKDKFTSYILLNKNYENRASKNVHVTAVCCELYGYKNLQLLELNKNTLNKQMKTKYYFKYSKT